MPLKLKSSASLTARVSCHYDGLNDEKYNVWQF